MGSIFEGSGDTCTWWGVGRGSIEAMEDFLQVTFGPVPAEGIRVCQTERQDRSNAGRVQGRGEVHGDRKVSTTEWGWAGRPLSNESRNKRVQ